MKCNEMHGKKGKLPSQTSNHATNPYHLNNQPSPSSPPPPTPSHTPSVTMSSLRGVAGAAWGGGAYISSRLMPSRCAFWVTGSFFLFYFNSIFFLPPNQ
jgi:hypothetical protein